MLQRYALTTTVRFRKPDAPEERIGKIVGTDPNPCHKFQKPGEMAYLIESSTLAKLTWIPESCIIGYQS